MEILNTKNVEEEFISAIKNGKVEVVKYWLENNKILASFYEEAMTAALDSNNQIIRGLLFEGLPKYFPDFQIFQYTNYCVICLVY